jgi:NADP-dependent 3-hydroxy acid dehydrogenase YdfG
MDLDGARTLVTGATGGLGAAIARACVARGAQLIITGRREEPLSALAAELGAQCVVADLADHDDADAAARRFGWQIGAREVIDAVLADHGRSA